jgi:hypothetical protein
VGIANYVRYEVGGPYVMGLRKCIRRAWDNFANYVRYEVGDGSRVLFRQDVWCGVQPFKVSFLELFTIACGKDAWVADDMQLDNENIHWNIIFTRMVHD